jgi:hypothetical protein
VSHLSEHELDVLLTEAVCHDAQMRGRARFVPIVPLISRLTAELREVREQASERERMLYLEQDWS